MALALTAPTVEDPAALLNFEQLAKILGGGTTAFVLTADSNGNASWAAIPMNSLNLEPPAPPTQPTRAFGTVYTPNASRPVLVNAAVTAFANANTTSNVALTANGVSYGTVAGIAAGAGGGNQVWTLVTFLVGAGNSYEFITTGAGGFGLTVTEQVL